MIPKVPFKRDPTALHPSVCVQMRKSTLSKSGVILLFDTRNALLQNKFHQHFCLNIDVVGCAHNSCGISILLTAGRAFHPDWSLLHTVSRSEVQLTLQPLCGLIEKHPGNQESGLRRKDKRGDVCPPMNILRGFTTDHYKVNRSIFYVSQFRL